MVIVRNRKFTSYATPLKFEYDSVGDILYISLVASYVGQVVEPLAYNLVARRSPANGALEQLEIQFFTRWLFKNPGAGPANLAEMFAQTAA